VTSEVTDILLGSSSLAASLTLDTMGFFGSMLLLTAEDATYIFIALLMFLLMFKAGLHILEIYCNRNGFKELLENLYREFMMMGLISFG
jgi:hypothetical protein